MSTPEPDRPQDQTAPQLPVIPQHVTREIFVSALRASLVLLAVVAVLGVGIGALVAGESGVWGALLGVGVTVVFSGTTIWSMVYTAEKSPNTTMAVVLGAWALKMVLLVALLVPLGGMDFFHHAIFGIVVLVGVVGSAGLDMRSVVRGRQPYIDPR